MGGIVMATTINAAASAGLVTTADTSTILQLQTNGITGIQVDASQKVTFANSLTSPTLVTPVINGMASSILTSGTAVASTSGTSIDFTGIPSWVKRITVMFNGVSTSGTSIVQIQAGLTTPETTGYVSSVAGTNTTAIANAAFTSGFGLETSALATATTARQGVVIMNLVTGITWTAIGNISSSVPQMAMLAGSKTFSGVIDRVRITTVNGTDTFDAGSINIMYE